MRRGAVCIVRGKGPLPEFRWPMSERGELLTIGEVAALLNDLRWKIMPPGETPEIEVVEMGR